MLLHLQTPTVTAEPAGLAAGRVRATRPHKGPNVAAGSEACAIAAPCPFCQTGPTDRNESFEAFHGFAPFVSVPGVPDSLRVLQDCFPLGYAGAHLLVAPTAHDRSLAQFGAAAALRAATLGVVDAFKTLFPDCWVLAFEHGTGSIDDRVVKCGGCHVDHAHGHLLALGGDCDFETLAGMTEESLAALGWDLEAQGARGDTLLGGVRGFTGDHPYLHVAAATPAGRVSHTFRQADGAGNIPSQLLRRLISTASRRPQAAHWNWKVALEHGIESRLSAYRRDALAFRRAYRETFGR